MKVDVGIDVMIRAFNIHWGKKRKVVMYSLYVLSVVIICLGIFILSKNHYRHFRGYFYIIAGTLAITITSITNRIFRWSLTKQYKQMGEDMTDVEMTFDSDALYIKTPKSETKIGWGTFIKWKEEDGLILAYRNDAYFQVIPIEQFLQKDREDIRNFISANSLNVK